MKVCRKVERKACQTYKNYAGDIQILIIEQSKVYKTHQSIIIIRDIAIGGVEGVIASTLGGLIRNLGSMSVENVLSIINAPHKNKELLLKNNFCW